MKATTKMKKNVTYVLVDGDLDFIIRPDAVSCTGCPEEENYMATSLAEIRKLRTEASEDTEMPRQEIMILKQTNEVIE